MRQVISAGAVIFRREPRTTPPGSVRGEPDGQVQFLLLYHGRGYWNFPKGKIEQGEQAMATFFREVDEETGLKRHDLRMVPGFRTTERFTFFDRYAGRRGRRDQGARQVFKTVIYYLVEARKRHVVISEEHEGFGWFTYAEALRIAKYKNTQNILKRAHEFIQQHLRRHPAHPPRPGRHVR